MTSSGSPRSALTSSVVMPTSGSFAFAVLIAEAAVTEADFDFDCVASPGLAAAFAISRLDGTQPIESNWHGKFWYSGDPSLATHLNISAEAESDTQDAARRANAMSRAIEPFT